MEINFFLDLFRRLLNYDSGLEVFGGWCMGKTSYGKHTLIDITELKDLKKKK